MQLREERLERGAERHAQCACDEAAPSSSAQCGSFHVISMQFSIDASIEMRSGISTQSRASDLPLRKHRELLSKFVSQFLFFECRGSLGALENPGIKIHGKRQAKINSEKERTI